MLKRRKSKVEKKPNCPLKECLTFLGGAWTPNIIWYLKAGPRRFSELKYDLESISSKVLTQKLKRLEGLNIVKRQVLPTSPPTVEYSLTELGIELRPALEAIAKVGQRLRMKERG